MKSSTIREAVIVDACRTALCKSFRGSFNMTRADDLAAHVLKSLLQRVPQLDPSRVEKSSSDVVFRRAARDECGACGSTASGLADHDQRHDDQSFLFIRFASHRFGSATDSNWTIASVLAGGVESITATFKAKIDPNPVVQKEYPGSTW